ncbi:MAG TPA: nucleotidyl transferase AbiEii/AbiGii toxin family protein [Solirubrobacterales bacterium]|jgi:hypothetical protein
MNATRHRPDEMLVEVASLFNLLGGMAPRHLALIGGLVPPLLVPAPAPHHRGSADIDLTLSVAITTGETALYYRSLEKRLEPFFEPFEADFRWKKREGVPGLPLLVDFMGPEIEATQVADGTLRLEAETAASNVGSTLRPLPLKAAGVVDVDAVTRLVEGVSLVYEPGVRADVEIRHTGPVGFLASKADAFATRSDAKDGYDVSWWCIHAAPDPDVVARLVTERDAFRNEYFQESVALLMRAFRAPDYPGPSGFANEENRGADPSDAAFAEARNLAYAAVSPVLDRLRDALWVE